MTRKDFELIAAVLKRTKPSPFTTSYASSYLTWRGIVREFGEQLKLTNGRFNLDKFEKAAGVDND